MARDRVSFDVEAKGWEFPQVGCLKLNTYGGVDIIFGFAYIGGLVRDHNEDWVFGYG